MANSFNFDGTDLSTYGLKVKNCNIPDFAQESARQLIQDISYSFQPKRPPKVITIEAIVQGASRSTLDGYLDNIKVITVSESACKLKLDSITDRYWMAKLVSFTGSYLTAGIYEGILTFQADDPMAYDNTETSSDHSINADPKTVTEAVGGTGTVNPVYTLTAKENLGAVTIKLENLSLNEELQWDGSLTTDDELEIDVANWTVKKNGTDDMSDVSGKFPRLAANLTNSIKVTALYSSVAGELNIKYRKRYF